GRDIWPLLSGMGKPPADSVLYWNIGQAKSIMDGDWKLIVPRAKGANPELYNITDDPFEKKNLAADKPDVVATLRKKLEEQGNWAPCCCGPLPWGGGSSAHGEPRPQGSGLPSEPR